jgi:hypothetical protein
MRHRGIQGHCGGGHAPHRDHWHSATNITATGATLNGTVNPNGLSTTVKFKYGTTTAYGSSKSGGTLAGSADQAVTATLTTLTCGTKYHFKVKATNSSGTTNGADATFKTSACADAVIMTTSSATDTSKTKSADANTAVSPASDFDGDGKSDILFRDVSTGQTAVWMMNGSAVKSNTATSLTQDNGWSVQGVGDFDGDKKYDLLWRNVSSGELVVWTMNGSQVTSDVTTDVNPGSYTSLTGWSVISEETIR